MALISKIIEKIFHDKTNEFLLDTKLLHNYYSGFRTNHSTILGLSFLTDKNIKGFDEGLLIWIILINPQKNVDTVNHKVLLNKLEAIGLSD